MAVEWREVEPTEADTALLESSPKIPLRVFRRKRVTWTVRTWLGEKFIEYQTDSLWVAIKMFYAILKVRKS